MKVKVHQFLHWLNGIFQFNIRFKVNGQVLMQNKHGLGQLLWRSKFDPIFSPLCVFLKNVGGH